MTALTTTPRPHTVCREIPSAMRKPKATPTARRYCLPDPLAGITDELILERIPDGARVLDLGCGDGRLLAALRDKRRCGIQGIELDQEEVVRAVARGVPVLKVDLDDGLGDISDDAFDFAVLSQTLQQVRQPRLLLQEMLRVARRALVVVPNFGHWRVRWQVTTGGRVPVTSALPYEWYNTPNLHFMSMLDFRELAADVGLRITLELPLRKGRAMPGAWLANLRADSALYELERAPAP